MTRRSTHVAFVMILLVLLMGCGSDSGQSPNGSSASAPGDVLTVTEVLGRSTDGTIRVNGFVLWTGDGARLCQDLLESYPPQCGRPSLPITNPGALTDVLGDNGLDEADGVRWTPRSIEIDGTWDGQTFVLS